MKATLFFLLSIFNCIQLSLIYLYLYIRRYDTMEFYSFYFPARQLNCTQFSCVFFLSVL